MKEILNDLTALFEEAKQRKEFDFVLTLINYTQIGSKVEISDKLTPAATDMPAALVILPAHL